MTRRRSLTAVVAGFGCGDVRFATEITVGGAVATGFAPMATGWVEPCVGGFALLGCCAIINNEKRLSLDYDGG